MSPSIRQTQTAALAAALLVSSAGPARAQTAFIAVGNLGGGVAQSDAWAIARNGRTIVGGSPDAGSSPNDAAFKWVDFGPIAPLAPGAGNDLPGGNIRSTAYAVNADGSVIVGASAYSGVRTHAFKIGPGDGALVDLGNIANQDPPLPATNDISLASGISDDGSVIVGRGVRQSTLQNEACYWLNGQPGAVGIGDLPGGVTRSQAWGVSGNGLVIVGEGNSASGREAFSWTQIGGMVGLGDDAGGAFDSTAYAASADGSIVVGYVTSASGAEAARWSSGVLRALGDLPGGAVDAVAYACSANGAVLVGAGDAGLRDNSIPGFPFTIYEAFVWDVRDGFRRVADALGPTLPPGWVLNTANGVTITDAATIIVGTGTNPAGEPEGFIAMLPRFCVGDFNAGGGVTVQDIFDFLAAYFASLPSADVNGSGTVTVQDIFDFLVAYFAGC